MGRIPYIERKQPVQKVNRVRKSQPEGWLSAAEQFDILVSCIKIGFKVTPLNYLTPEGKCSCKNDCGTPGKHPRYKGWPDKGIDSLKRLRLEFRKNRGFNWCCVTGKASDIFVLDVDTKEDGPKSLADFEAKYGALPATLTQTTGSGGKHYIFRYPIDGRRIKNSVGKVGKGLDIRSDRGQIAISPSIHKSGNRYQFDAPPGTVEIAEAPEWLLSLVCVVEEPVAQLTQEQIAEYNRQHESFRKSGANFAARRYVEAALEAEINNVLSAGDHRRNKTLNDAAFNLGKYIPSGLLSRDEVYNSLLQAALAIGLETFESDATILSGISGGQKKPKLPPERDYQHDDDDWYGALDGVVATVGQADQAGFISPHHSSSSTSTTRVSRMSRAEQAEFDAIFGETLSRELELQKDPKAYAAFNSAEIASQRLHADQLTEKAHRLGTTPLRQRLTASQQCDLELLKLREKGEGKAQAGQATVDSLSETADIPVSHPYGRCEHCNPANHHRPCHRCAAGKLGVMRPRPDDAPCTRGGRFLVQCTTPGKHGRLSEFSPKCGMWGCPKCGYDNECDHLSHYTMFANQLQDSAEQPYLQLPHYNVEVLGTKPVPVQHGCQKIIIPESVRRKYGNKLSKMGVYYVADYIGQEKYAFYCFLPMGFDSVRLSYQAKLKYSPWAQEESQTTHLYEPQQITFTEFDWEHRNNLSNAGRFVKLSKSDWDLCDQPEGARKRHMAVVYCKALRMPKRMISTKKNKLVGGIVIDQEAVLAACHEFGVDVSRADTRKIDRSFKRGLTQYLLKYWRFEFDDWAPPEKIEAFIKRLTGKDRVIEPVGEQDDLFTGTTGDAINAGSDCLSYPLVT